LVLDDSELNDVVARACEDVAVAIVKGYLAPFRCAIDPLVAYAQVNDLYTASGEDAAFNAVAVLGRWVFPDETDHGFDVAIFQLEPCVPPVNPLASQVCAIRICHGGIHHRG
jgi:hypothetical protein